MDDISSRPRVQGNSSPLSLRRSGQPLTDGAGLLTLRALWDRLDFGSWLDDRLSHLPGRFRPSLMVELWVALLWYGGGWLSDLQRLQRRGIRRLFGWARVPVPTTFGRWLRRAGEPVSRAVDELIRRLVRRRWERRGVPNSVTLVLDSTVVVRYGTEQAGAETGYNPRKPGRPSHHPLLAFTQETGDLIGLRWRPGSAWAADGVEEWLPELVTWLRDVGVGDITVRLDKGFYAERVVRTLQELEVSYLLKVPNHGHVRDQLGSWRESTGAEGIFEEAASVHTSSGRLWGDRLLSLEGRRPLEGEEALDLDTYEVTETAHILTDKPGIHALTAWRAYNAGAVVEQRIEELKQLSVGQTAVDDLAGNRLLWTLGGLAYQLLHLLRSRFSDAWKRAQPKRLRAWAFRTPAKLTRHARKWRVHLTGEELSGGLLPRALAGLRGPPA